MANTFYASNKPMINPDSYATSINNAAYQTRVATNISIDNMKDHLRLVRIYDSVKEKVDQQQALKVRQRRVRAMNQEYKYIKRHDPNYFKIKEYMAP